MVRVRAAIAVLGCAAMLLAGCGGASGGGAVDGSGASTASPVTRGDVIAESPSASPSVPASTPGAPASLTASPGVSTVSLTWTPPLSDGGSAITGYNVEVYSNKTGFVPAAGCTSAATSTARTCTVIDLTSGTYYHFRVRAVNAAGSGLGVIVSETTSASVETTSGSVETTSGVAPAADCKIGQLVPSKPTNVTATGANLSVTLSWGLPSCADVYGYRVQVSTSATGTFAAAAGCTGAADSTSLTCTATGLETYGQYWFRVAGVNFFGTGSYSVPVSGTPTAAVGAPTTAPGTPTSVMATSGNASSVVSWTAPASNGGSAVTGYSVQVSTSATGTFAAVAGCTGAAASTSLTCTATGLTNGSTYWFKVAAKNSVGTGASASAVSVTPLLPVPSAPSSVRATSGDASAVLSWAAPASNGGPAVTGYSVQVSTSATGTFAAAAGCTGAAASASLTCTATGLTNGSTYWFKVAAKNSAGTGASASAVSVTPLPSVPSAPTSVKATSGNALAVLSWTAPTSSASSGGSVTGYSVQVSTSATGTFAAAAGCTGAEVSTSLTCTATGLTNGSTYWFKVAATNAAGLGAYSSAVSVQLPLYPIGSTGPGGGVIFYWSATPFTSTGSSCGTNCQYLEAQRTDLGKLAWCSDLRGRKVDGAGGDAIGDGFRNTDVGMRSSTCSGGAGFRARASTSGGMTDWYVPSSDELIALYAKRSIVGGFTTAKGRQYTETDSGNAWYWTSSQRAGSGGFAEEAKAGDFSNGTGVAANKNNSYRVRLIRAF